jgi:hypothetical protein
LKMVAFCSFIHTLYPFSRLVVGSCVKTGGRIGKEAVDLYASLYSLHTRALVLSIHSVLSS